MKRTIIDYFLKSLNFETFLLAAALTEKKMVSPPPSRDHPHPTLRGPNTKTTLFFCSFCS